MKRALDPFLRGPLLTLSATLRSTCVYDEYVQHFLSSQLLAGRESLSLSVHKSCEEKVNFVSRKDAIVAILSMWAFREKSNNVKSIE